MCYSERLWVYIHSSGSGRLRPRPPQREGAPRRLRRRLRLLRLEAARWREKIREFGRDRAICGGDGRRGIGVL